MSLCRVVLASSGFNGDDALAGTGGTLRDSFSLKVEPSEQMVVRICIFATPEQEDGLFDGLRIVDPTGKTVGVETDAYSNVTSDAPTSIYPQRDFLLDSKSFKNLKGREPENFEIKFPCRPRLSHPGEYF